MRFSRYHIPTLKEAPRDAELASHVFLVRGGYMRMMAAGIYDFLPLGQRVLRKVSEIIRQELDRAGALEVLLPAVQPSDLWVESGRWEKYGPELLRFRDRHDREFCLGPTHEEVITDLVRRDVRSYRDLPLNLYQIQFKFRDEIKPRGGLMRGREFIMKDGYSFDKNADSAKETYWAMYHAYERIFRRCGLQFAAVEADTGNIGGTMSHEFQVMADTGEDYVFQCSSCGFTVNQELAPLPEVPLAPAPAGLPAFSKVSTPGAHTVEQVAEFFKIAGSDLIKTLIYNVDGQAVAALVRGDQEVSEVKLRRALGASTVELADEATILKVTGAPVGFAGPVGLTIPIIADFGLTGSGAMVVGANADQHHLRDTVLGRDYQPSRFADIREPVDQDPCPRCGKGLYRLFRGIEVGHVFFLGTKYSAPMNCNFLDEDGKEQHCVMGCYGIGVTRIMASAIEQRHDAKGICWPEAIAPFQVTILPMQMNEPRVVEAAEKLTADLEALGLEVLLDDRDLRPGVKFADADLVGIPWRIIIGTKRLDAGEVELVRRQGAEASVVSLAEVAALVKANVQAALDAGRSA
jgi:prolyl-tRNA synthetase